MKVPGTRRFFALRATAGLAMLMAWGGSAHAIDLQQAYDAALKNDPAYRMQFYEREASKENRIIGRSSLLPSVNASYNFNRNVSDLTVIQGTNESLTHPRYLSRSANIQLRQPLINFDALARYRQGVATSNEGEARFQARTAELAVRVIGAYTDALFAEDQIALIKAQRDTYMEQMSVNKRLFEKGEGTKTDMLEVQARLDLAEAQLVEAEDHQRAMRLTLEGIVGGDVGTLAQLVPDFQFGTEQPAPFDEWRTLALENNATLKAARFSIEAARQEIKKARAGHLPRLDFVATYGRSDADTITTRNQETLNRALGMQLNVPIYQGGQVNAITRQAGAGLSRAQADLDVKTNDVMIELRKAHSIVLSSVAKVGALVKATESGELLAVATEQSIKGGVRINLDLLNAQQQLASSRRDLAQARYAYLVAVLRLRAASGTLTGDDLREISGYFQ